MDFTRFRKMESAEPKIKEPAISTVELSEDKKMLIQEIENSTITEWCHRPDKPTLFVRSPYGEILFVCDRKAYEEFIKEGKVVFSPLELERMVFALREGLMTEDTIKAIVETKRVFPGARIEEVKAPSGSVDSCQQAVLGKGEKPLLRSEV